MLEYEIVGFDDPICIDVVSKSGGGPSITLWRHPNKDLLRRGHAVMKDSGWVDYVIENPEGRIDYQGIHAILTRINNCEDHEVSLALARPSAVAK